MNLKQWPVDSVSGVSGVFLGLLKQPHKYDLIFQVVFS